MCAKFNIAAFPASKTVRETTKRARGFLDAKIAEPTRANDRSCEGSHSGAGSVARSHRCSTRTRNASLSASAVLQKRGSLAACAVPSVSPKTFLFLCADRRSRGQRALMLTPWRRRLGLVLGVFRTPLRRRVFDARVPRPEVILVYLVLFVDVIVGRRRKTLPRSLWCCQR